MFWLHICPFTICKQCLWSAEKVVRSLELELLMIVNCCVLTGNKTWSLKSKKINAHKPLKLSPAPLPSFSFGSFAIQSN